MLIAILYNEASEDAAVDERDVIVQRDTVAMSLAECGHEIRLVGCTLDLAATKLALSECQPDVVFNLVESLSGTDRLAPLVPLLLDSMGIPYTGAPSAAMLATANKPAAKQKLCEAGLPTPDWIGPRDTKFVQRGIQRFIVKPVWEHASIGMDDDSVVQTDESNIPRLIRQRQDAASREYFAERFIAGREFNLALLASSAGPVSLPPAEIDFSAYPPGKPRIVGYRAKWDEQSFEYQQTPRQFAFAAADRPLIEQLSELARKCWFTFGLRGYARVDFRVDELGEPWILEINTNPCLSPDAGFAAAIERAGIGFAEAMQRIVDDALRERSQPSGPDTHSLANGCHVRR